MARQSDGKAAHARRLALASAATLATLLVAGCERDAERDAGAEKRRAQLPYQLAIALAEVAPTPPLPKAGAPRVEPRRTAQPALVGSSAPPKAEAARTQPGPTTHPALAASSAPPPMPESATPWPVTFVLDIPPPVAPQTSASRLELPDEAAPALAAVSPSPKAAPAIAIAPPRLAAVSHADGDRGVYIPQITESARAAYIAQVDPVSPEQRLAVRSGDSVLGTVQFQVTDGVVSVNIGQVLDLFQGRLDSARFAELRGSQAAHSFVSLDRLQGAGIPLEYNAAYDELTLTPHSG